MINKRKVNRLFSIFDTGLLIYKKKEEFHFFFINLYKKFHFITKLSINFFLIIIDFLSILFFFKKFKNLSIKQAKFIINLVSYSKTLNKVNYLIKVYILIFIFSK